jgi:hypothetical protein
MKTPAKSRPARRSAKSRAPAQAKSAAPEPDGSFPIVAIGASAGGLKAFCDEASRPREVLFTLLDVTAQKERECALKSRCDELERRLRAAPSGVSSKPEKRAQGLRGH